MSLRSYAELHDCDLDTLVKRGSKVIKSGQPWAPIVGNPSSRAHGQNGAQGQNGVYRARTHGLDLVPPGGPGKYVSLSSRKIFSEPGNRGDERRLTQIIQDGERAYDACHPKKRKINIWPILFTITFIGLLTLLILL